MALRPAAPLGAVLPRVEHDVLAYVKARGFASMRQLTRALPWPSTLVVMSVGSLLGRRALQDSPRELEWLFMPTTGPET